MTPAPAAASRLRVGSSANTTCGIHDERPRDRARCCSPPEFPVQRPRAAARPRRSNSTPTRASRCGCRRAARAAGVLHAVSSGTRRNDWKTNPTCSRRKRERCASEPWSSRRPATVTAPRVGRSSPASRCRSVDLPEPEADHGHEFVHGDSRSTPSSTARAASPRRGCAQSARHSIGPVTARRVGTPGEHGCDAGPPSAAAPSGYGRGVSGPRVTLVEPVRPLLARPYRDGRRDVADRAGARQVPELVPADHALRGPGARAGDLDLRAQGAYRAGCPSARAATTASAPSRRARCRRRRRGAGGRRPTGPPQHAFGGAELAILRLCDAIAGRGRDAHRVRHTGSSRS